MAQIRRPKKKELELAKFAHLISIKRNPRDHMYLPLDSRSYAHPKGGYGTYINVSPKIGLKIHHEGFSSKKRLLSSDAWQRALEEFNNIESARKKLRTAAPKPYRIFPMMVKVSSDRWDPETRTSKPYTRYEWRSAIAMEHIKGEANASYFQIEEARAILGSADIHHGDLHGNNIIIRKSNAKNKSKIVIIDWDGRFVKFQTDPSFNKSPISGS
jgi:RIO-like serine/threonine protein kinase